jgi:hypothetical protein
LKFEIQISRYSRAPQNNNLMFKIPKLFHFLAITSTFSATKRRAAITTKFPNATAPDQTRKLEKTKENLPVRTSTSEKLRGEKMFSS